MKFLDRVRKKNPGKPDLPEAGVEKTLFVDAQRRIGMYLRALWGCEFAMKPTARHFENRPGWKSFVKGGAIHLPNAYGDFLRQGAETVPGLEIYRAASAHAAAHLMYTKGVISDPSLNRWQKAVISVVEDARVEALAIRRFPGLKQLWVRQHVATSERKETAGDYLNRLARALLDENYRDGDPWVEKGRNLFQKEKDLEKGHFSLEMGIALADSFKKRKIRFKTRTDLQSAPYRDDNRCLWDSGKAEPAEDKTVRPKSKRKIKSFRYASFFGFTKEAASATGDKAKQISILSALLKFVPDILTVNEREAGEPVSDPYFYSEWDYRNQVDCPSWVTLREMRPKTGDLQLIGDIIARHRHLISRMQVVLDAIRPSGVRRLRKLEEGDEIDVNAAIRAQVDVRIGMQPDPRIMMRTLRKNRDISILVLLDLSKSTTEKVQGQDHTVLELTQQVCVLLADAIEKVGDPFAIHGFCSDSRHYVEYFRLKDFDQPYDEVPKAKIAGMTGQLSTRMGAAVRHATYHLNRQKSGKKLLMLITDGEPSDVDVRDRQYLRHDTKKAVEEASRNGINTYCMSLDPGADQYVSRIFGARNYMVVDHVRRLPEKMLLLYAGLTR